VKDEPDAPCLVVMVKAALLREQLREAQRTYIPLLL